MHTFLKGTKLIYHMNFLQLIMYVSFHKYVEDGTQLLGIYDPTVAFQPNIYLNECLLDDLDLLKFTYVHEIMHLLGFVDNETVMLMEGLSDCLAENILGYCYTGSYDVPRELSHQLLIADPDLISYIINGEMLMIELTDLLSYLMRNQFHLWPWSIYCTK